MTDATSGEGFLTRWSRLKREAVNEAAHGAADQLPDIASLRADSDYAPFMARDVEASVRRLALKTLFADPHFNIMDGLDVYIGDYNKVDPVTPAMLAALSQAQLFLKKLDEVAAGDERSTAADPTPGSAC